MYHFKYLRKRIAISWSTPCLAGALTLVLVMSGCASMSNRTKTLIAMAGVGIAAGTAGAMMAPVDENAWVHGALWGGGAAALTGAVGMFVFNEQARSREFERELKVAKDEIEALKWGSGTSEEKLIFESTAMDREVPEDLRKLLSPGWIKIYQTSMWIKQGDDSLVHQDKVIRIKKPQLVPNNDEKDGGGKK